MECCGDPFEVGSRVSWIVSDTDSDDGDAISYRYNHHGPEEGDEHPVSRVVREIEAVCLEYSAASEDPRVLEPMPDSETRIECASVDRDTGWRLRPMPPKPDGPRCVGYAVELEIDADHVATP